MVGSSRKNTKVKKMPKGSSNNVSFLFTKQRLVKKYKLFSNFWIQNIFEKENHGALKIVDKIIATLSPSDASVT